jgi:hypothetical protein
MHGRIEGFIFGVTGKFVSKEVAMVIIGPLRECTTAFRMAARP